ncbi:Zinc finger, C4 type [Aphelenchoides besseyi]|nr:Zinc finger, C4 type [Aphelenchoides besseyi]
MKHQRHRRKPINDDCPICMGPVEGRHFGIRACRPCGSFFRRTIISKHVYRCLFNSSCEINYAVRSICKGCRIRRCIECGMDQNAVQKAPRDPIGPKKREAKIETQTQIKQIPSVGSSMSSRSNSTLLPDEPLTLLQLMINSFQHYKTCEISLYNLLFPERPMNTEHQYTLAKHTDFIKMERGSLSFTYSMVKEWYPKLDTFPIDTKMEILKNFFSHMSPLIKAYRSSVTFPDPNDPRFIMAYGQYIDAEGLEYHYQDDPDPKESAKACFPLYILSRRFTNKIAHLQVREIEFIGLCGLVFCTEVRLVFPHSEIDVFHDRLIFELHENIRFNYSTNTIGSRLGALVLLINDTDIMRTNISEAVTICRLFTPHFSELWND